MRVVFVRNAELVTRKSRSSVVVHRSGCSYKEINVRDIEALVVMGSKTKIETGVIALLSRYNIPLTVVSKLGVSVLATPVVTLYNETRRAQYTLSEDEKVEIMRGILKAKFAGFANILKYHGINTPEFEVDESLARQNLLLWEANTSRKYWQLLLNLVPGNLLNELKERYGFQGRKPRSKDPFNQSVSALYAVLYSIATKALLASGLDPTCGLHHKTRYSTPLVYDYVEMYKPIAVHAMVKLLRKTGKLPELDEDGYLNRDSLNAILKEFYNIMKAKIRGTRLTPHRAIYIHAFKLAMRMRTRDKSIKFTFIYNPKKITQPPE